MAKIDLIKNIMKQFESDKNIIEFFKKNNVVLAYIFGSYVENNIGVLSDVDIAVFFDRRINYGELFEAKLKLIADLTDYLKREDIDIVVLNEAPPLISHRILRDGKLLFCLDEKERLDYERGAIMRYLDWEPFLRKYTQEILSA